MVIGGKEVKFVPWSSVVALERELQSEWMSWPSGYVDLDSSCKLWKENREVVITNYKQSVNML